MTQDEFLSRLEIQRKAYKRVVDSWRWVEELASADSFTDDYLCSLSADGENGPMPCAEVLMCLLNTTETSYKQLDLPQPSVELIETVFDRLSQRVETLGFSGAPYVSLPVGSPPPPEFTDSVCYLAGAATRLLATGLLVDSKRRKRAENLGLRCLDWLLNARISSELDGKQWHAWSWSSPSGDLPERFRKQLPPQTYFTSQVMITLLELLFDNYSLVSDRVGRVLESIMGAKRFLLATIAPYPKDDTRCGWVDFDEEIARRCGATEISSYSKHEKPGARVPDPALTLYPLEALSYIRYYMREPGYQETRWRLKQAVGGELDGLSDFTTTEDDSLDKAFAFGLSLVEEASVFELPCEIQIPEPFNLKREEDGVFFKKEKNASKSLYMDGTVGYNLLNALNFYVRYAEEDAGNTVAFSAWRQVEVEFASHLLDSGFSGKAFTHASTFARPAVIYATRTAVASFLSWGVSPTASGLGGLDDGVRRKIEELHALICDVHSQEGAQKEEQVVALTSRSIMCLGFLIGIVAGRLRGIKDTSPDFAEYYDLAENKEQFSYQTALRTNGRDLLERMGTVVIGGARAIEELQRLKDSAFLSKCYKPLLNVAARELASDGGSLSATVLEEMISNIIAAVPQRDRALLEDMYGN